MRKLMLGLLAFVMCFNSFKGMAQDPFEIRCEPTQTFMDLSQNLNTDIIGQWHNDYLDFLFQKIDENNICVNDKDFNHKINSF